MAVAEELKLVVKAEVNKAVADMRRFNTTAQQSKRGVSKLGSELGSWAIRLVSFTAALMALRKAMHFAFDAAQYAAKFSQIEMAFDNITKQAGTTSKAVMRSIREMSLGTISDLELMRSASRAALFDIPLDKLDKLMNISMASATAMGESVEYMFSSIVTGIGRASPLIIDNLGLTMRTGEAVKVYAERLGKAVDELTFSERKQAILNETLRAGEIILEKVGDAALTLTDQNMWEAATNSVANMKKEIGTRLLPVFRSLAEATKEFADDLGRAVKYKNLLKDIADGGSTLEKQIEQINLEIEFLQERLEDMTGRGRGKGVAGMVRENIKALEEERLMLIRISETRRILTERAGEDEKLADRLRAEGVKAAGIAAEELQKYLKEVQDAHALTPEGQKKALEAAIAHWEGHLKTANKTAPAIIDILKQMREELADMGKVEEVDDPWPERVRAIAQGTQAAMDLYDLQTQALLTAEKERAQIAKEEAAKVKEIWEKAANERVEGINQEVQMAMDLYELQTQALVTAEEERAKIQKEADDRQEAAIRKQQDDAEKMAAAIVSTMSPFAEAIGEVFHEGAEGWESFADATKDAVARMLSMFAQMAFAKAAYFAGISMAPGFQANIPAAIALAAAGTGLMAAAGVVKALGKGGVVTKPTMALIGERGPEAVIPLDKAGMGNITIIQNIRGSVIAERQAQGFAVKAISKAMRRY